MHAGRVGAPLWQLVDFHPDVHGASRAGIEAVLQAAGLSDAWVTPDGAWRDSAGMALPHDENWLIRPQHAQSRAA